MPPGMVERQDRERPLRLVQDGDEFVRIDSHRASSCFDSSAREASTARTAATTIPRLELLARAFDVPLELSLLVNPSVSLVEQMTDGRLEGIVLKDRTSTYRDGTRVGWSKVKDRSWYEREAWRFDRR